MSHTLTERVVERYKLKMAATRIWIDKGQLVTPTQVSGDVTDYACSRLGFDADNIIWGSGDFPPLPFGLRTQLYDENDKPLTGHGANYRGPGTVNDQKNFVILGDEYKDATLTEYRMDKEPTKESLDEYDAIQSGIWSALSRPKPLRRNTGKGEHWLYGYDEALKWRKKTLKR